MLLGFTMFGFFSNCCRSYILVSLILWGTAGYAYHANKKLPAGDPKKKDFRPLAVNLVPLTWPAILIYYFAVLIGYLVLFILKALLYGIFLILFTIALVLIRKPFLLKWLDKIATKVGNILLEANTLLLKLLLDPWVGNHQPHKIKDASPTGFSYFISPK